MSLSFAKHFTVQKKPTMYLLWSEAKSFSVHSLWIKGVNTHPKIASSWMVREHVWAEAASLWLWTEKHLMNRVVFSPTSSTQEKPCIRRFSGSAGSQCLVNHWEARSILKDIVSNAYRTQFRDKVSITFNYNPDTIQMITFWRTCFWLIYIVVDFWSLIFLCQFVPTRDLGERLILVVPIVLDY